jgi:hypothetical protein
MRRWTSAADLSARLHVFACRACWSLVTPHEGDLNRAPAFASLHMLLVITYFLLRFPMAPCVHSMAPFPHIIGNSLFEQGTFITTSLCLVFRSIALGASLRGRLQAHGESFEHFLQSRHHDEVTNKSLSIAMQLEISAFDSNMMTTGERSPNRRLGVTSMAGFFDCVNSTEAHPLCHRH